MHDPDLRPRPGFFQLGPVHIVGAIYLTQSIPLLMVGMALPPILRELGVDLRVIGALGLLLLPWALKALWAPMVDRIGTRRQWLVGAQIVIVAALLALGKTDPTGPVWQLFLPLVVMAFASGTLDIAADGLSVERLDRRQYPLGGALQSATGAGGVVIGGALTLLIHAQAGWAAAMGFVAALSVLGLVPILMIGAGPVRRGEPPAPERPSIGRFLRRDGALSLVALAALFRFPDGMASATARPFLVDQGLSLTQIGSVTGLSGALLGVIGAAAAGLAIRRWGLMRFLVFLVVFRTLTQAGFAALAAQGGASEAALVGLAAIHALSAYLEVAGLYVIFLRAASLSQAGTDVAILGSAAALAFALGSATAGATAEALGYAVTFAAGATLCLAGGWHALARIRGLGRITGDGEPAAGSGGRTSP